MGISFPQEDVARLVGQIGPGRGSRLLFGGGSIDQAEALSICLADGSLDELQALCALILENDGESIATLKRGIRLAGEGRMNDSEQDRVFDALLASEVLARRLAARRRR
jgi:enoyl-CoA hydratase/carnithine racemase